MTGDFLLPLALNKKLGCSFLCCQMSKARRRNKRLKLVQELQLVKNEIRILSPREWTPPHTPVVFTEGRFPKCALSRAQNSHFPLPFERLPRRLIIPLEEPNIVETIKGALPQKRCKTWIFFAINNCFLSLKNCNYRVKQTLPKLVTVDYILNTNSEFCLLLHFAIEKNIVAFTLSLERDLFIPDRSISKRYSVQRNSVKCRTSWWNVWNVCDQVFGQYIPRYALVSLSS